MFYPAKYQQKFIFILRCLILPFVLLLLVGTISQAKAMSNNDLLFSNPNSEEQQIDSEPLYDLTLSYRCDNISGQYWTVTNSNGFEMTFEWFLETNENGTGVIPAYGSYTMQTENIGQTVTIRYTFPRKDDCQDEKCGETEIIKLTATSTTCEFNPEVIHSSPQEVVKSNNLANTTHNNVSHASRLRFDPNQTSYLLTIAKLNLDHFTSNEFFIYRNDAFINKIAAGLFYYPGYQYVQES